MVSGFPGYPLVWGGGLGKMRGEKEEPLAKILNKADDVGSFFFPWEKEQKGRMDVFQQRRWLCFAPLDVL